MAESASSVRELARALGISHTTVSQALRDSPRVLPATKEKVLAAAKAAGYRYNPLAGALMSEMRRSRGGAFRGVIAVLDVDGPEQRPPNAVRYHRCLLDGAMERATELGFKAEVFTVGRKGVSLERLDKILQSRGIRGIFLLPIAGQPDLTRLDWTRYAGVYADYLIERPALHAVCSDHYRSMVLTLQRLKALGYRRPGLVLHEDHDKRLLYRWEASYRAYVGHDGTEKPIPVLIMPSYDEALFRKWFKKEKPDVVLAHRSDFVGWMENAGVSVPSQAGFCSLNVVMSEVPCAGIDQRPKMLASRGIELLTAQLYHNEYGVPVAPSTTTIPAIWHDGPTLRVHESVAVTA